jgi:hypothetical protein
MGRITTRQVTCAILTTLSAASVCGAQSAARSPSLETVLDRLGAYLLDYETKLFEVVAEEEYEQWIKRRSGYGGATVQRRRLKSTYFLVRLPDGRAWYGFREVTSVDGRAIAAEGRPMAQVLRERTATAYEEATALVHANAKYNIGDVYRTVNIPLQALALLHPEHRDRFEFTLAGRERVRGQDTAVVTFNEHATPTLIHDGFGGNLLSRGRVWVEPATGAVLRTELAFTEFAVSHLKDATLRVEFQHDSRVQLLTPVEMEETYGLDIEVVHGRASYRNYRRFETGGRLVAPPQ